MHKIACRILVSIVTFLLGLTCTPSTADNAGIPALDHRGREIIEIRLQRQGCTDPSEECRRYDVTFRRDGRAQYVGYENCPDFIGAYHTTVNPLYFDRLAELIEKGGFFDLKAEYGTEWINEKQTITVVTNEGIKSITAYNSIDIPPELWTITGMVDYQVFELCWDKDIPVPNTRVNL
jgi:hypothetical protein